MQNTKERISLFNGLWVDDLNYNRGILTVIICIEILLSYSPIGFIFFPNITVTTVYLAVLAAALWGGPLYGGITGLVFGLCSMWKATATAVSKTDIIFSPMYSGDVVGSICLSLMPRMLLGVFAGFFYYFVRKYVPKKMHLLIVFFSSFIFERIHAAMVYHLADEIFNIDGINILLVFDFSRYDNQMLEWIVGGTLMCLLYIAYEKFLSKNYFYEYKKYKNQEIRPTKMYLFSASLFLFVSILLIIHFIKRLNIVLFEISGLTQDIVSRSRIVHLSLQMLLGISAAIFITIYIFNHKRNIEIYKTKNKELEIIRKNNEKLAEALAETEKANNAKTEFLSRMSHDLRTPMNAIIGLTTIASDNIGNDEKVMDSLSKIDVSSKHLLALINEVLEMQRIESGKTDIKNSPIDICDVIHDFLIITQTQCREHLHNFKININDIKHEMVYADELRIKQILINLTSNAIKYTPDGGNITFSFSEGEYDDNTKMCKYKFMVSDNGVGMSKEFLPHVFEPFARENDSRISRVPGTGLGMPIVKSLVELMGGTITVDSVENSGTTITVRICLKKQEVNDELIKLKRLKEDLKKNAVSEKSISGAAILKEKTHENKKALLVEDQELNMEIAREFLEMTGILVETASNGKEAVDMVKEKPDGYYNIVIMDLQMPVMNGLEATKKIRSLGRNYTDNIPIVAMTANAFSEDENACMDAGMNDYMSKPVDIQKLRNVLDKWI